MGGLVKRLGRRCAFYFDRKYRWTVLFVGLVLEVGGIAMWKEWQPWSSVLVGVGGSVLATVLVGFLGPDGDEVYQAFLRLGVREFYSSRKGVPDDRWVTWLREAQQHFIQLGQSNGNWCKDHGFPAALLERVRAGVEVEFFFLDPTGDAAKVRSKEDRTKVDPLRTRTKASIREVWRIRQELPEGIRERLKLYVYNATPSLGLTWWDTTMTVTHYLAGLENLTSPALRVEYRPGSDTLYWVYGENVEVIRTRFSTPITADNVHDYSTEEIDGHR
jgi:hypothetical protein